MESIAIKRFSSEWYSCNYMFVTFPPFSFRKVPLDTLSTKIGKIALHPCANCIDIYTKKAEFDHYGQIQLLIFYVLFSRSLLENP